MLDDTHQSYIMDDLCQHTDGVGRKTEKTIIRTHSVGYIKE